MGRALRRAAPAPCPQVRRALRRAAPAPCPRVRRALRRAAPAPCPGWAVRSAARLRPRVPGWAVRSAARLRPHGPQVHRALRRAPPAPCPRVRRALRHRVPARGSAGPPLSALRRPDRPAQTPSPFAVRRYALPPDTVVRSAPMIPPSCEKKSAARLAGPAAPVVARSRRELILSPSSLSLRPSRDSRVRPAFRPVLVAHV